VTSSGQGMEGQTNKGERGRNLFSFPWSLTWLAPTLPIKHYTDNALNDRARKRQKNSSKKNSGIYIWFVFKKKERDN
jgi:hypothetical protein